MRSYLILIFFLGLGLSAIAQKPVLDTGTYGNWPAADHAAISGTGNYVAYTMTGQMDKHARLILKNIRNNRERVFTLSPDDRYLFSDPVFSHDGHYLVFSTAHDSLCFFELSTEKSENIGNVHNFHSQPEGRWLAYLREGHLVLRDPDKNRATRIDSVSAYWLPDDGDRVYYQVKDRECQKLYVLSLSGGKSQMIWRGVLKGQPVFSPGGRAMAFAGSKKQSDPNAAWYFHADADSAVCLVTITQPNSELAEVNGFTPDGKTLLVSLETRKTTPKPINGIASLDVWSYRDARLQSEGRHQPEPVKAAILLDHPHIVPIVRENESSINASSFTIVKSKSKSGFGETADWNPYAHTSISIITNADGSRISLPASAKYCYFSPNEQYVIYFDKAPNFYSYSTADRNITKLTQSISTNWTAHHDGAAPGSEPEPRNYGQPIAWFANDEAFLVNDRYDIWQLDPKGIKAPLNLTNGYGQQHHIIFSFAIKPANDMVKGGDKLILAAFNADTKESGFFSLTIGKAGDPELLTMGPYFYSDFNKATGHDLFMGTENAAPVKFAPIKAQNANIYLIRRMSATKFPNYYLTKDFRSFHPVSDIHPERKYNWLTSELVTWKQLDGTPLQGILYKPENFDRHKKYPLLFYYYETLSDALNIYRTPAPSGSSLNAPFYASNGYLVFYCDIAPRVGEPGKSALDAVVSAAKYLGRQPYVDTMKMALYGFSFGSFRTNYIITHSHLFAAACSMNGFTDGVFGSGELSNIFDGDNGQSYWKNGQDAIGAFLWEKPELYIDNSPVLRAKEVTTPLLMLYDKQDKRTFSHGVQLFTALRTQGKKAWLLQYDEEGHGLPYMGFGERSKVAMDFDFRLRQFYDFYLKSRPAPIWMLDGIPSELKGTEDGLQLDTTGRVPGPGLPQMREELENKKPANQN